MAKPGVAFGDFISEGDHKSRNFNYEGKEKSSKNWFLLTFAIVLFGVLLARIFFLQVVRGFYFRDLSDNNRTKTVVIHAPRGIIFDRNNTPLVFNTPGFRGISNGKTTFVSQNDALNIIAASNAADAKGKINLEIDSLRDYPYKEAFSHVVGYLGQISKEELSIPRYSKYQLADVLGKSGIEQQYEQELKGTDGKQLYEVDAKGSNVRKLGEDDPIPGQNVVTTLDAKLQIATFNASKDIKKGAVIVTNPQGEILSLISKPSFDPNLFTLDKNYKPASQSSYVKLESVLLDSENQPLLDRSIGGTYPPGSTFKLVVAAAGLSDKIIDENWKISDTGVLRVGAFSFSNWYYTGYGGTDGEVNVVKGIKRSNDIFFYKLAEKIGVDKISQKAQEFGLGKISGVDLQGEAAGLVPTREWKQKEVGESWYLGDTYHYGIGQGYVLTTPLQVNLWTQTIANGGTLYVPHLVKGQRSSIRQAQDGNVKGRNLLDGKSSSLIRQGMVESCNPGGVAWPLFNFTVKNPKLKVDGKNILDASGASTSANFRDYRHVVVACKTGTAEHGGKADKPHAWITLFAPAYNPEIIVTVLSESSGEGSNVAAPIAKKILEEWFSR